MLEGAFQHEDFCGHKGTINPGDLQWMTAGRGIVHSEMPAGDGDNVGLQLWINLKAQDKVGLPLVLASTLVLELTSALVLTLVNISY